MDLKLDEERTILVISQHLDANELYPPGFHKEMPTDEQGLYEDGMTAAFRSVGISHEVYDELIRKAKLKLIGDRACR